MSQDMEKEAAVAVEATIEAEEAEVTGTAIEALVGVAEAEPQSETDPRGSPEATDEQTDVPVQASGPAAPELDATEAEDDKKWKAPKPKTALSELQVGVETTGRVVGVADFGAFVDIGAVTDGLVHISELSDGRVGKVSDVVSVGQQVGVWVKDIDIDQERISLSMRPRPAYRLRDLKPGMVLPGTVTSIQDYGIFVDIGSETEGLVHVSEMAEGYVTRPSELVSAGDDVEVRIKKIDRKRRRISLSMKGFGPPARSHEPSVEEPLPTAMELAMRRALGELEEEIDETADELIDVEEATRDELGDVFARMLREYRSSTETA